MKPAPLFLLTVLSFVCGLAIGQGNFSPVKRTGNYHPAAGNEAAVFDQYIQKALPLWKTPGLSVVVVKDGKVVFGKGYGVAELGKSSPYTTATVSICASTTKAMTAVCMGMLVDEGKIKWSDKLKSIYPGFRLYDPYVTDELTVKDLFTHNTGLGNADMLWELGYSREEILRKMQLLPPAYSFRSSFIYQNLMYLVAGELIRQLSGQPWEDFISQRLFAPLGMDHTFASYKRSRGENNLEVPHFLIGDSVRPILSLEKDNIGPAGGVWSCANDMGKWMLFLLDSATTSGGKRLLSAGVYGELFKPQAIVPENEFYPSVQLTHPHWTTYGLGWFQEDYRGKMVQFHTGSLDGAVAIAGLLPSEHFGIYVFGNLDHTEIRHALLYKALDLWGFRGNKPETGRDWSTEFYALYKKIREEGKKKEKEKEAARVPGTKPSLPLASYAGQYENEIYGNVIIKQSGDSLIMEFPNNTRLYLQHWHYDTFIGKYNYFWYDKSWVRFSLDEKGKVMQFEMDGTVYKLKPLN